MWVREAPCGCSYKHLFILQLFILTLYIAHMCIMFMLGLSTHLSLLFEKKKLYKNIPDIAEMLFYFHVSFFKLYVIIFPQYYRK